MLTAAFVALVAFAPASTASDAAVDAGTTLNTVDALRARGEYDKAAAELRGWIERWNHGSIHDPSFLAQAEHMQALMKKMVEMEALLARARDDEGAARSYLRHVVNPAEPSTRTAEQARALLLMARHDKEVMAMVNAAFPARLSIEVDAGLMEDPNLLAFPLESALVEVSRDHFPIVRGAGSSEMRVRIVMRENDTSKSGLFAGTSMKSYAMHMTAEIVAPDGEALLRAATTTAVLGINPGNGVKGGVQRCAQLLYQQLVDELAKRAALGA
jgi:hypothetical protein